MPRGAYLLDDSVTERFSCAPGAAGWRYAATRTDAASGAPLGRLDLVLDDRGRMLRLLVEAGGWAVRGGVAGAEVAWRRGDEQHVAPAAGFTGSSPAFAVATARLLGLAVGDRRRVVLVQLDDHTLAGLDVDEGWLLTGRQEHDGLAVDRYEVADLATGRRRTVHLAGDVVLSVTAEPGHGAQPSAVLTELERPSP